MSDPLREEFLHVAHVDHESAIIGWGAFFFDIGPLKKSSVWRTYEVLDDNELRQRKLRKRGSIGRVTEQYGDRARVRVGRVKNQNGAFGAYFDPAEDPDAGVAWGPWTDVEFNTHFRFEDLQPRTRYRYQVEIDGTRWDQGGHAFEPRATDARKGQYRAEPMRRRHEFVTFPAPDGSSGDFSFAVIGDPGTGKPEQYSVGRALAARVEPEKIRFVLTTGDNIYARGGKLGKIIRGALGRAASSGDEDDDWFASWFLPYRDTLSRVPVFPAIGNHDSEQSEDDDDLGQMMDNFYLEDRFPEASLWGIGDERHDAIFYCFRYGKDAEFVAVDTSFSDRLKGQDLLDQLITAVKGKRRPPLLAQNHKDFLQEIRNDPRRPAWRIPFGHHPPYTLGPSHKNTQLVQELAVDLKTHAGVRVWLSGHEHNFQHHARDGLDYVLSGAAGKAKPLKGKNGGPPPDDAVSYTATPHALVANLRGGRLRFRLFNEDGQVMPQRLAAPAVPSLVDVPAA
jgi:tartrate-resistant acid phosphatase type 5